MILRRVGVFSIAKVCGVLYALLGFIVGGCLALASVLGAAFSNSEFGPLTGLLFGAGAFIFLPILYGFLGFCATALMAWLYNLVAGMIGGIEVELAPGALAQPAGAIPGAQP